MSKKQENARGEEIEPSAMAQALKEAEARVMGKIKLRMLRLSKDKRLQKRMEDEIHKSLNIKK